MWILEPTELFKLFGHSFGIGFRLDYTMLIHLLTIGSFVWPGCYLWRRILRIYKKYAFEVGVLIATILTIVLECFQSWQFHFGCGYFGIGDFSVIVLFMGIVWFIYLRKIK